MQTSIEKLFTKEYIEYRAVLPFSEVVTTKTHLLDGLGFVPKSVLLFLLPYYTGETENLSRYAASLDYHLGIAQIGGRLTAGLESLFPGAHFSVFGDHSPLDERRAALTAGLGIAGDNGLLINEKYGSYVFIADILTDVAPEELGLTPTVEIRSCENCGACKVHCPTGILRGEGADCLSAITQRKGTLTEDEVALMKAYRTVWGCDECQCHCPHNRHPEKTPIPFFYQERLPALSRPVLDAMDDEAFARRAFAWRGRAVVERNVKILEE